MAKSKIIKELANNEISLEVALNRLYIIATDIQDENLQNWAENEINGYPEVKLPEYRIAHNTMITYSKINGGFQATNHPLPLKELLEPEDPNQFSMPIREGIGTILTYSNDNTSHKVGRDLTWLQGLVYKKTGLQCYSIMQTVPVNFFQGILNSIKMALMKIFLKLEQTYGCLDDLDINLESISDEKIAKTEREIYKYIYVDNSISIGDRNKIEIDSIGK